MSIANKWRGDRTSTERPRTTRRLFTPGPAGSTSRFTPPIRRCPPTDGRRHWPQRAVHHRRRQLLHRHHDESVGGHLRPSQCHHRRRHQQRQPVASFSTSAQALRWQHPAVNTSPPANSSGAPSQAATTGTARMPEPQWQHPSLPELPLWSARPIPASRRPRSATASPPPLAPPPETQPPAQTRIRS